MAEIQEAKGPVPRPDSPVKKGLTVQEKNADVTLKLMEEHGDDFGPLTPETEKKLRRKLYWRVMLLLSAINIMLFVSDPLTQAVVTLSQERD
jgi:hypothetical protein